MFMKRTVLPIRLQEKLTKLIKDLTALKKASFISLLVTNVANNMLTRQLKIFCYRWDNYRSNSCNHAQGMSWMQELLYKHFCDSEHSGFLNYVSIKFID